MFTIISWIMLSFLNSVQFITEEVAVRYLHLQVAKPPKIWRKNKPTSDSTPILIGWILKLKQLISGANANHILGQTVGQCIRKLQERKARKQMEQAWESKKVTWGPSLELFSESLVSREVSLGGRSETSCHFAILDLRITLKGSRFVTLSR